MLLGEATAYARHLMRVGVARPRPAVGLATLSTSLAMVVVAWVSFYALFFISYSSCTGYCELMRSGSASAGLSGSGPGKPCDLPGRVARRVW